MSQLIWIICVMKAYGTLVAYVLVCVALTANYFPNHVAPGLLWFNTTRQYIFLFSGYILTGLAQLSATLLVFSVFFRAR